MIAAYGLVGSAALLLMATAVTADRPDARAPDLEGYYARWGDLHHGYDPRANRWVRGLLRASYALARPLARWGVAPTALTLWGVWLAFAALVAAHAGGRWPVVGGVLLVASGFSDTLDGAVAAMTGRATRWGFVVDSLADRVTDVVYLVAVWAVGAPGWLAVACGVAFGLLEYLRARAGNAGMGQIGVVTVGERPVRVLLCAAALLLAGAVVEHHGLVAVVAVGVLAVLSAVALVQLAVVVHRTLAGARAGPP